MSEDKNRKDKDIDEISGVETTGHEWDGLKELNNPLPRWWLWVFYATLVWCVWYWVVYPAWPTLGGATKGTDGYTQQNELAESQGEIFARQQAYLNRFEKASFQDILEDPELYAFAVAGGASAFKDNCATCHGAGGIGAPGYPNLNDDDWLWGGTLADIHQTLEHGIRAGNMDTRMSQMPAFGKEGLLKREEIESVVDHVMYISGQSEEDNMHGAEIFKQQCASCHGETGKGSREFGAPNLTDKIWLYGGERGTIFQTVYNSRAGMMPAWGTRLDENTLKQLTVYLHQLGGGEEEPENVPDEPESAE
ncbi:MAG: cytochrome-c oxidase, cbb3-type subunit III [Alphaproteobacteria bacterium]